MPRRRGYVLGRVGEEDDLDVGELLETGSASPETSAGSSTVLTTSPQLSSIASLRSLRM